MTTLAYVFIGATVLLFGGFFITGKDAKSGDGHFIVLFFLLLTVAISGIGLSLGTLGLHPTVSW